MALCLGLLSSPFPAVLQALLAKRDYIQVHLTVQKLQYTTNTL